MVTIRLAKAKAKVDFSVSGGLLVAGTWRRCITILACYLVVC